MVIGGPAVGDMTLRARAARETLHVLASAVRIPETTVTVHEHYGHDRPPADPGMEADLMGNPTLRSARTNYSEEGL